MVDSPEIVGAIQKVDVISVNNLPKEEWALGSKLRFEPAILAQDQWQKLIAITQASGNEKAVTVTWDGKKLATHGDVMSTKNSSGLAIFPRGIRSVFARHEELLVSAHAHPTPPELDHVQTIPFSDQDINSFINDPSYKAYIALDRGGVHLLARNPYAYSLRLDPAEKPVFTGAGEASKEESTKHGLAIDIMRKIAQGLVPFGIKYYYSPNLSLTPEGIVELTDVSTL